MATRERRLHLAHFSLDSDGDDSDETNTPTHANGHTCALVWCDEDTARDPPPGCRPVDPLAGLASMGETYRGVRGDEAVAACVGPCATSAHVIPDATQRPKPDEHLGGHVFTSSSTSALKTSHLRRRYPRRPWRSAFASRPHFERERMHPWAANPGDRHGCASWEPGPARRDSPSPACSPAGLMILDRSSC